jgi:hypothetical protein
MISRVLISLGDFVGALYVAEIVWRKVRVSLIK